MRLIDAFTGIDLAEALPAGRPNDAEYGRLGDRVACCYDAGILVASASGMLRGIAIRLRVQGAIWLDDDRVLVTGEDRAGRRAAVVAAVDTGGLTPFEGLARAAWPRLAVTGRFDITRLRSTLRQVDRPTPMTAAQRSQRRKAARRHFEDAVRTTGIDASLIGDAQPAIRYEVRLSDDETSGLSRFGGRPDLPRAAA